MQLRFHREMFIIFISFEKIYRRTDQNWQLNKTDTRHTHIHHKSERERKEGVSIPLNLMVSVSKAILNVIQSLGSISREITQDLSSFFFLIGSLRAHTHTFPSQVVILTIHEFWIVAGTSSLTQYRIHNAMRPRVYH